MTRRTTGGKTSSAGFTDIGVTSLGSTSSELATSSAKTSYLYAPLDLNSVVVAFHINDAVTGQAITSVTLTPRLLARLITDSDLLDFFTDPEFLKLNPGHHWPSLGASQPLLRAERNADTWLITDWMIQDPDAKAFIAGKDKYGIPVTPDFLNQPYPVPNFEKAASDDGFDPLTGETLVAQHMFYGVKPADSTVTRPSTEGFFGIMDRDTAAQWGLSMANLVNHAGQAVGPDDASVMAGYKDMTTLNGVKVANFGSTDPAQYPLTKIDYAMVRQKITSADLNTGAQEPDPTKVKNLKTFLDWESTTGQQHLLEGYLPLPAAEVAQTKKVASEITVGTGPPSRRPRRPPTTIPATTSDCCPAVASESSGLATSGDTTPPDSTPPPTTAPKHHKPRHRSVEPRRGPGTELVAGRSGRRLDHAEPAVVRAGARHRRARGPARVVRESEGHVARARPGRGPERRRVERSGVVSDTETLPVAAPVIANELTVVLAPERDSGVQLGTPDLPKSTRDTVYRVLQHGLTLFVLLCVALMGFLVVGTDLMHSRYQRQLLDKFRSADQLETLPPLTPDGAAPSTGPGANGTVNSTGGFGSASTTNTANTPIVTGTPIALLRIPRIHVSEVVAEGTNSAQTLHGPGHLPATPLPGQLGNAVVIGRHSTGGAPFGSLGSLKPGDHFSFVVYSGTVTYRVLSVRTYHASDMSIFGTQHAAGKSINTATLITSTSMFDSNRRLAVVGQLQGTPAGFTPGHIAPNDSDLGLALNHGGLVALAFALQLLLLASIGAVWLVKRWHRLAAWTVATPVVLCCTWLVFEQFAHILPSAL